MKYFSCVWNIFSVQERGSGALRRGGDDGRGGAGVWRAGGADPQLRDARPRLRPRPRLGAPHLLASLPPAVVVKLYTSSYFYQRLNQFKKVHGHSVNLSEWSIISILLCSVTSDQSEGKIQLNLMYMQPIMNQPSWILVCWNFGKTTTFFIF